MIKSIVHAGGESTRLKEIYDGPKRALTETSIHVTKYVFKPFTSQFWQTIHTSKSVTNRTCPSIAQLAATLQQPVSYNTFKRAPIATKTSMQNI